MATEKRLIRYEDVYQYAYKGANGGNLEDEDFDAIVNAIESVPAVDAVEVVRCKDCVHRHTRYNCQGRRMDFFCANGKRVGGCKNG